MNPVETTQPDNPEIVEELLCIADTNWVLGHWYIKCIQNGRSLTDFNALSAMAQDVLGHTRALFSLLEQKNPGAANYLEFNRSREQIHSMQVLDIPPRNWADLIVTAALVEQAIDIVFDYSEGKHVGLAALSKKCLQEREFHALYFDGLIECFEGQDREDALNAVRTRLPLVLEWTKTHGSDPVHANGYRSISMTEIASRYIERCTERFASTLPELDISAIITSATMLHDNWDYARRRPAGSSLPAPLWEFVLPTNPHAVMCRRPLNISNDDNIRFTAV